MRRVPVKTSAQQQERVEQLVRMAQEELAKRHAAEQELANVKAALERERNNALERHAAVCQELDDLKAKVKALGACYRGLFIWRE